MPASVPLEILLAVRNIIVGWMAWMVAVGVVYALVVHTEKILERLLAFCAVLTLILLCYYTGAALFK
jgi:hypothetical protein